MCPPETKNKMAPDIPHACFSLPISDNEKQYWTNCSICHSLPQKRAKWPQIPHEPHFSSTLSHTLFYSKVRIPYFCPPVMMWVIQNKNLDLPIRLKVLPPHILGQNTCMYRTKSSDPHRKLTSYKVHCLLLS